jgi:hypothetical protein
MHKYFQRRMQIPYQLLSQGNLSLFHPHQCQYFVKRQDFVRQNVGENKKFLFQVVKKVSSVRRLCCWQKERGLVLFL